MNDAQTRPDWAPDNCPDQVVQLLEHEQFLQNLGVRGLASADSQQVRTAVHRLQKALAQADYRGYVRGAWAGVLIGLAIGAALGAGVYFVALAP